jgi:hypothetical protein
VIKSTAEKSSTDLVLINVIYLLFNPQQISIFQSIPIYLVNTEKYERYQTFNVFASEKQQVQQFEGKIIIDNYNDGQKRVIVRAHTS